MRVIQLTADADGRVRLDVPAGPAEAEYEVAVVLNAKPTTNGTGHKPGTDALGWPIGYHETMYGCIDDESFVAPPRGMPRPVPPLDAD